MAAAFDSRLRRPPGMSRLLDHCEALRRVTGRDVGTARTRLEHELGAELTARLVGALSGGHARSALSL